MRLGLRQSLFGATLLGTLVLAAGCASTGQLDILESRLRRQEDAANQLQSQLAESQNQLQAAKRETVDLRTQIANGKKLAHAEQLTALGTVEGISLNKYLTGGLDRDGIPGDEMLSAVVAPADADGNLVKAPGTVVVTVLDLSKPEAQQRVGHWEFGPKDSESLWHSGFLGSGYVVRVPWQTLPESPTLLVHARLKTIDGRQFDTSQSIRINPPKAVAQAAAQPAAPQNPTPQPGSMPQPPEIQQTAAPPPSLDTAMTKPPAAPLNQADAKTSDEWWADTKR
ncbi:MAG TPA: hypothetical protein VG055_15980 [Planctomycetaceae bacterium]|jgi:outer membrane murein-binding lipoprotein Lpp|nr:hypothetical protein [Planctomycetaceae bacterium]